MYETPSPEELKKFMVDNNLTGADVAALAGVSARTARHWIEPVNTKGWRSMPWAAWAMILLLTGKKTVDEILKTVDNWKRETRGWGLFERGPAGRPWPQKEREG